MSLAIKLTHHSIPISHSRPHFQVLSSPLLFLWISSSSSSSSDPFFLSIFMREFGSKGIHDSLHMRVSFAKRIDSRLLHSLRRRPCLANTSDNTQELSDASKHEGSSEREDTMKAKSPTNNEILTKLKSYGVSGILSYGLLNTAYYLTTFLFVWLYVVPSPKKMGYLAAVERFLKVMAMVWAGSQVTKLVRAGGALALAPFVVRGLLWFTAKFQFESQGKAFMAIVAFCFGLAMLIFLAITLLWA